MTFVEVLTLKDAFRASPSRDESDFQTEFTFVEKIFFKRKTTLWLTRGRRDSVCRKP